MTVYSSKDKSSHKMTSAHLLFKLLDTAHLTSHSILLSSCAMSITKKALLGYQQWRLNKNSDKQ